MKSLYKVFGFFASGFLLLILNCTNDKWPFLPSKDIVYHSSFESENSLKGWEGLDPSSLYDDAPAVGGKKSIYISGGCIVPHASYELPAQGRDCRMVFSCWGKNLSNGGAVLLDLKGEFSNGISVSIENKEWTFYQSADTLFCPKTMPLQIAMMAGGFVPSSMLIDEITIRIVD